MSTITGWLGKSAPLSDILYFKAEDKCVTAYHSFGDIILSKTIDSLAIDHADDFILCARGMLVSRSRISAFSHNPITRAWKLYLDGAGVIPMSRRHSKSVLAAIPGLTRKTINSSRMTKEKYAANVLAGVVE